MNRGLLYVENSVDKNKFRDIYLKKIQVVQFSFVHIRFLYFFGSVTSGLRTPFPLACALGHEVAFAVNAALMGVNGSTARELFSCICSVSEHF